MSSITISQIQYILALERTGSFSEAAASCHITQSTLSTMIRKLENQLEFNLFDRKSKPIQLTVEGERLITQLKVIHNEYENLLELVQKTKNEFYGTFKIGIIPTLAPFLLPLFLDKLVHQYPSVNFSIQEITTGEITNLLKLRALDVGILSLPIPEKELEQRVLFDEDFLVYDTRNHSKTKTKYKVKDIDVSRLWLLEESHCITGQIEKICHLKKKKNTNGNLIFRSGSMHSLLELVKLNKGLTLIPRLATLQNNLIDENFVYKLENPVPVRQVGLVMNPNLTKKRLIQVLEEEIVEAIQKNLKQSATTQIIHPF